MCLTHWLHTHFSKVMAVPLSANPGPCENKTRPVSRVTFSFLSQVAMIQKSQKRSEKNQQATINKQKQFPKCASSSDTTCLSLLPPGTNTTPPHCGMLHKNTYAWIIAADSRATNTAVYLCCRHRHTTVTYQAAAMDYFSILLFNTQVWENKYCWYQPPIVNIQENTSRTLNSHQLIPFHIIIFFLLRLNTLAVSHAHKTIK